MTSATELLAGYSLPSIGQVPKEVQARLDEPLFAHATDQHVNSVQVTGEEQRGPVESSCGCLFNVSELRVIHGQGLKPPTSG